MPHGWYTCKLSWRHPSTKFTVRSAALAWAPHPKHTLQPLAPRCHEPEAAPRASVPACHGTRQNTWHDRRHRHRPSTPISPVAALPYQERKQAAWQGWGRLVTWVAPQSRGAPPRPHQRRRRAPSRAPWRPQRPSPRCQPSCGPARRAAAPASSCPAARRRARPAPGSCPARTPAGPRAPRRPARRAARGQGLGHSAYPHNDWRECAAWLAATTALARTCPAARRRARRAPDSRPTHAAGAGPFCEWGTRGYGCARECVRAARQASACWGRPRSAQLYRSSSKVARSADVQSSSLRVCQQTGSERLQPITLLLAA